MKTALGDQQTCVICRQLFRVPPSHRAKRVTCSRSCSSALKAARARYSNEQSGIDVDELRRLYAAGASIRELTGTTGQTWDRIWRLLGKPTFQDIGVRERPTETGIAWAAGFFDGEGCVQISRVGQLSAVANQTSLEPLETLRDMFGGRVHTVGQRQPHYRQMWSWLITNAQARAFLVAALPYLHVKQQVATFAVNAYDSFTWGTSWKVPDSAEWERRQAAHDGVLAINQRRELAA